MLRAMREQAAVVPAGDGANGGLVAPTRQIDQILIGQRIGVSLLGLRQRHNRYSPLRCVRCIGSRKVPEVAAIKIVLPARHLF